MIYSNSSSMYDVGRINLRIYILPYVQISSYQIILTDKDQFNAFHYNIV